ncbi:MAG TPA: hypothetical protein VFW96_17085 [Thermomicrobiales bacterium]|nr:hypothetical protein [Thermomicrobiales bacterium]
MMDYARTLIRQHQRAGIIVDTNLLLLLLVGGLDRALIARFKRTRALFIADDYPAVAAVVDSFQRVLTTPHILAEVSNFVGNAPEDWRRGLYTVLANALAPPNSAIALLDERYTRGAELVRDHAFSLFGLTDAGIGHLARDRYLVFTVDAPLADYLGRIGVAALNYNHIRGLAWT